MKKIEKLYDEKIVKWFYILLPIIEVITTYMVRNTSFPITIGMVYKTLFLIYCLFYLLFIDKKKKVYNYLLIGVFALSIIINMIVTVDISSIGTIMNKLIDISKYMCFPIVMMFLYKYMLNGNKVSLTTLVYSATIYATIMIIAKLFGTQLPTYTSNPDYGHSGWFYSGNEISALMSMFYPIIIYFTSKYGNKLMIYSLAAVTYGLLAIGTKTSFVAITITIISIIIFELVMYLIKKTKLSKRMLFISFLLGVVVLASSPYSPSLNFMIERFENAKNNVDMNEPDSDKVMLQTFVFNGREKNVADQSEQFKNAPLKEKIFGLSDSNKVLDENGKSDVIERDFYDILFTYGYFGIIVYFAPMIIIVSIFMKRLFSDFKKECNEKNFVMGVSIMLSLGISYIAGHVLLAPTVAIFLSVLFAKLNEPEELERKNSWLTEEKKLIIYMPKLSTGGMEMALINLLNISSIKKNYKVTLCLGYCTDRELLKMLPTDIKLRLLCKGQWNSFGKIVAALRYIVEFIDAIFNRYDIAICYSYHHAVLSKLSRIASPNSILFMHTDLLNSRTEEERNRLIKNVSFSKFKAIVCVSEAAKISLEKLMPDYKGKMIVANNYINGKQIVKLSKEKIENNELEKKENLITFINVARHFEKAKKISRIILSASKLHKEGYDFRVVLVGSGEDTEKYRKMIKEEKLEDVVLLVGNQINPYKYIRESECMIVSSDFEGYGIVIDESRILNIPVISTDVADAKTILQQGYGICVENSENGIYQGMKKFLTEGYEIKKKFDFNNFNAKIDKNLVNIFRYCEDNE